MDLSASAVVINYTKRRYIKCTDMHLIPMMRTVTAKTCDGLTAVVVIAGLRRCRTNKRDGREYARLPAAGPQRFAEVWLSQTTRGRVAMASGLDLLYGQTNAGVDDITSHTIRLVPPALTPRAWLYTRATPADKGEPRIFHWR